MFIPTTGVLEAKIFDRRLLLLGTTEALADDNFKLHTEVVCTNNSGEPRSKIRVVIKFCKKTERGILLRLKKGEGLGLETGQGCRWMAT